MRDRISNLNYEIKMHFASIKTNLLRSKIIPGNSKTLWDAAKTAKNICTPKIPPDMTLNNETVDQNDRSIQL